MTETEKVSIAYAIKLLNGTHRPSVDDPEGAVGEAMVILAGLLSSRPAWQRPQS